MVRLAIRGHKTRGSEVIALLEMLGGINSNNLYGDKGYDYYIVDSDKEIKGGFYVFGDELLCHFTLEEFEEKFPYKVGDRVIYEDERREITKMVWEEQTNTVAYKLDDKLYCNVINKLHPYKEKTMETAKITITPQRHWNEDKIELEVTNGYEIKEENGKYYAVKKQPKYPKTYEECCSILGCKADHFFTDFSYNSCDVEISDYEDKIDDLLQIFRKLIYCRDAYWKIAGEQMRLGKPWEYDLSKDKFSYAISYQYGYIQNTEIRNKNIILVFPTEEMRNAFYKNFKELIETCKELL